MLMPGGFRALPDELRHTAGKIGDVVSEVAGAVWQGPSGDYGHAGVQAGWAGFIEDMRSHVADLRAGAERHGAGLIATAQSYLDSEEDARGLVGASASLLDDAGSPVPAEMPTGFLPSSIAQRLDPDGLDEPRPGEAR
jgi:hypothetical protein